MDIPQEVVKPQRPPILAQPMVTATVFGLFSYVILYFILVVLLLPALALDANLEATNSYELPVFWGIALSLIFAVETFQADYFLRPMKERGFRGGLATAAITAICLVGLAPLLFTDDYSRSSIYTLLLLLLTPFLGLSAGGYFVTRRTTSV